jgi:CBS domain-containing protein
MRVRDVMNTDVATATPGTPISEVARLMADKDVGSVVILEGSRPVGIVTDRDLVVDHLAQGHTADHPVREAVSTGNPLTGLVTVPPDMDVLDAAQELGRHKVGRLPVVQGEQLVGILSAGDISKQLKQALDGLLTEGEKAER